MLRPLRISTLLVFALWFSACGARGRNTQVAAPAAPTLGADAVAAIKGAVEKYRQALEVHSPEALAGIYVHELDLAVIHQGNWLRGWSAVEAYLSQRLSEGKKVRVMVRDLQIVALGEDAAVAHAQVETNIGDDSATITERGVLTLVFQRRNDTFQIVAEHFSQTPMS